jgi:hypothetical protein
MTIQDSFSVLRSYCRAENFMGWDPYDGLNSRIFQALPLKNWSYARLAWIQLFKRSPFNFRKIFLVPKQYNSKGIALFLSSYCNILRLAREGDRTFGSLESLVNQVNELARLLISLRSNGYSGSCWGYGFDWESKAFFLPRNTPTVVATSFAVEALLDAYSLTANEEYKEIALSSAGFILKDLNRIARSSGFFLFSYSPMDNRAVYNASLLGSKTLALIYKYTKDDALRDIAICTARGVLDEQNEDGSFPHSDQIGEGWRDSFHTGFKLESLSYVSRYCNETSFESKIQRGFNYWKDNYFDSETGFSFYYDRGKDPDLVDLHCVAQALATFHKVGFWNENVDLIDKILNWAIVNMQSPEGYFYFQKKRHYTNKISYSRWPNAWMMYGISYWLINQKKYGDN